MMKDRILRSRRGSLCGRVLFRQVLPRAEGFIPCAGYNGDQETRLMVEPGEEPVGFPVGFGGERVALFGSVDGYQEDLGFGEGQDVEFGVRGWGLKAL